MWEVRAPGFAIWFPDPGPPKNFVGFEKKSENFGRSIDRESRNKPFETHFFWYPPKIFFGRKNLEVGLHYIYLP